jgi:REP element-mobilizing transposase RayT
MSRKYKFNNQEGLYFVSFAVVYWIDVFTREEYFAIVTESLDYCRKNKGLEIYAWCIMPSHVHLIFRAKDNNPSVLLKELKTHTFKQVTFPYPLQRETEYNRAQPGEQERMDTVADGAGRPEKQQRKAPSVLATTQQTYRALEPCRDRSENRLHP